MLVVAVLIQRCVFTDNTDGPSSPTSPHPGNGVMAQPKKIIGIGFGDIFKEGSVKLRVSQRGHVNEEKKEKVSVVLCLTKYFLPVNCRTSSDSNNFIKENFYYCDFHDQNGQGCTIN